MSMHPERSPRISRAPAVLPSSYCLVFAPDGGLPTGGVVATTDSDGLAAQRPENALDALLDELQTFARPPVRKDSSGSLRRLHSYPSSSDESSPPVPAKPTPAARRVPPPPPPRTSSRSPLASPTSAAPSSPRTQPQMGVQTGTLRRGAAGRSSLREPRRASESAAPSGALIASTSNSSSCESVNSQEGAKPGKEARKELLEQRHQELLRKQKALQEQYARLQQLQRGTSGLSIPGPDLMLKKTGSESNLLAKIGLGSNLSAAAPMSGSLTHLAPKDQAPLAPLSLPVPASAPETAASTTKVYETDIL